MGNLGWYQTMATVTKTLGGPKKALTIVGTGMAIAGYGVFRGVEAGSKALYRLAVKNRDAQCLTKGLTFTVEEDADAGGGLVLRAGSEYRVMECDGGAVQIEVIGDADSPYFVSESLLSSISEYPSRD